MISFQRNELLKKEQRVILYQLLASIEPSGIVRRIILCCWARVSVCLSSGLQNSSIYRVVVDDVIFLVAIRWSDHRSSARILWKRILRCLFLKLSHTLQLCGGIFLMSRNCRKWRGYVWARIQSKYSVLTTYLKTEVTSVRWKLYSTAYIRVRSLVGDKLHRSSVPRFIHYPTVGFPSGVSFCHRFAA